jgi:uncharacterized SAM-binding protein YcdF (DUF218 family)
VRPFAADARRIPGRSVLRTKRLVEGDCGLLALLRLGRCMRTTSPSSCVPSSRRTTWPRSPRQERHHERDSRRRRRLPRTPRLRAAVAPPRRRSYIAVQMHTVARVGTLGMQAVAWFAEDWILRPGRRGEEVEADCIVVPGAFVRDDGSPSELLRARAVHAVELYRRGLSRQIILTGGAVQGLPAEAEVAHGLARAGGVPVDSMLMETESRDTFENIFNARRLMSPRGWRSCLVSTDVAHVRRCLLIARHLGLRPHAAPALASPGYTDPALRRMLVAHECAALLRYALSRRRVARQ